MENMFKFGKTFWNWSKSLHSHEWARQNSSLQHQLKVKHISDENKGKHQVGGY